MAELTHAERTAWLRAFVAAEHFRYRRSDFAGPRAGEFELRSGCRLHLEAPATPLTEQMVADCRTFCTTCLDVTPGEAAPGITWRLAEPPPPADPLDPAGEAFTLTVAAGGVVIAAAHERGLLHGTHYLERRWAERGGPYLAYGSAARAPRFTPRLSNSIFIASHQDLTDLAQFPPDYLGLMSHFGINGVHVHVHLAQVWCSPTLPELNAPPAERERLLAALRTQAERAARYGIGIYVYLANLVFPAAHPVFRAHPRARGARCDFNCCIDDGQQHCLCSSSPEVLAGYAETVAALFAAVPALAGGIVIVGGEGLVHCYTRPAQPHAGYTTCPHCQELAPAAPVAALVNRLAAAVKSTGRHKLLIAWPYSAFTWSGDDRAQTAWLRALSADVTPMANFDTGSAAPDRSGAHLYDYNIVELGPSPIFAEQARTVQALGRRMMAKTESNTTPGEFFLPYLPVHHRWHARFARMAATGVAGYVGQWRFYGMNGSPPEELQYGAVWQPERSADELLAAMARRDFGVAPEAAERVVTAWRQLSDAWDSFPYSAMTHGEREFYMRGPWYLGPAHPLIFNEQSAYGLSAPFFQVRGDAAEFGDAERLAELQRRGMPRYVCNLLFTLPYGVARYRELLARCRAQWEAGLAALEAELDPAQPRAQLELDVVRTIAIHLATLAHTLDFLAARDRLWQGPVDRAAFAAILAELAGTVRAEIANAKRALPLLDRDPRIGYGHCYGPVYDAAMVRDKLRQCRQVLAQELPSFSQGVRFHVWLDFRQKTPP